jgi:hypothetical protein
MKKVTEKRGTSKQGKISKKKKKKRNLLNKKAKIK